MLLERRERLLPASSPESAVGSSEAGSYRSSFWLSALLRGEAQIVGGVLELASVPAHHIVSLELYN